jgi:hypothetical protein
MKTIDELEKEVEKLKEAIKAAHKQGAASLSPDQFEWVCVPLEKVLPELQTVR